MNMHLFFFQVMKDLETYLTGFFSQTKEWREFYTEEMNTWNELQRFVKKQVMVDHQHQLESLSSCVSGK